MTEPKRGGSWGEKEIPWGHRLRYAVERQPGRTQNVVACIQAEVGHSVGSRATFLNLYRYSDPALLDSDYKERAWYMVVAIGEDPATWGIDPSCLPPAAYRSRDDTAERIRARVLQREEPSGTWEQQEQYEQAARDHATAGRHH